jgi:hypothetical protein
MGNENEDPAWKLKLRYGQTETSLQHFTVLADGLARTVGPEFGAPRGPAWMAMKVWSASGDEARHMISVIGKDIGFDVTGRIEVYSTDPAQPPRDNPVRLRHQIHDLRRR